MEVDGAQKLCQKYFFRRDAAGRVPTGKHNVVTFDTLSGLFYRIFVKFFAGIIARVEKNR